jgi:hypothetical protein
VALDGDVVADLDVVVLDPVVQIAQQTYQVALLLERELRLVLLSLLERNFQIFFYLLKVRIPL